MKKLNKLTPKMLNILKELASMPDSGGVCLKLHKKSKHNIVDKVCAGWHEDIKWLIEEAKEIFK